MCARVHACLLSVRTRMRALITCRKAMAAGAAASENGHAHVHAAAYATLSTSQSAESYFSLVGPSMPYGLHARTAREKL